MSILPYSSKIICLWLATEEIPNSDPWCVEVTSKEEIKECVQPMAVPWPAKSNLPQDKTG